MESNESIPAAVAVPRGRWTAGLWWGPILLMVSIVLWVWWNEHSIIYDYPWLLTSLNLVFLTCMAMLVVVLAARSFVKGGHPALCLLGAGMLAMALASGLSSLHVPAGRVNSMVALFNVGQCLAGVCSLAGALLLLRPARHSIFWPAGAMLILFYGLVIFTMAVIAIVVAGAEMLPFFIQGVGGTPIRQWILGCAAGSFAGAAGLMLWIGRRNRDRFTQRYGQGLLLIALGLWTVWTIRVMGTPLNWAGRAAQYAGSLYLLTAVFSAVRRSVTWTLPLKSLRQTQRWYNSLVNLCPDAILVHCEGKLVYANPAAARLLGAASPEQLMDLPVMEFVPPEIRAMIAQRIERNYTTRTPDTLSHQKLRRLDGAILDVDIVAAPIEFEGRPAAQVVIRDITGRCQTEQVLRDRIEELRTLMDLVPALVWVSHDPQCRQIAGNQAANSFYESAEGENVSAGWEQGQHLGPRRYFLEGRELSANELPMQQAATENREIRDVELEVLLPSGNRRFMWGSAVPLRDAAGGVRGSLSAFVDATERRRVHDDLHRTAQRLSLLTDVASRLMAAEEPQTVIDDLCQRAMEHLDCDVFFNYLVDPVIGKLRLNAAGGVSAEDKERLSLLDIGTAICGCVARDRQRIIAENIGPDCVGTPTEHVAALGVRAYCCHPLMAQGQVMGTLSFGSRRRDRFSEDDVAQMKAIADLVATAMQRLLLLQEARLKQREAESANAAKDRFFAVLSHELRTPLNPALMAATLLENDAALPAHLREDVSIIRRNIELEARLIDDMLDLTRITRGKLTLSKRVVDACEVLRHALDICHAEIAEKRLNLELSLPGEEAMVDADPARLQQIFWNLLKNAIKFTSESGSIRVEATMCGGRLRLRISDSGIGMDRAMLPRIFDAFEQGGPEVTRRFGGVGLGLAICRGLITLHEGTIEAHSDGPGRGAVFTVDLPLTTRRAVSLPVAPGAAAHGNVGHWRILLVEDHESTAVMTARLLRRLGHDVCLANSVASGLEAFERQTFDLIVSDLGLPDGTGHDLLRQVLSRRPVRAIALSGFGMETDLMRSNRSGFLEHLVKPINVQHLQNAIERAMTS